MKSKPALSLVLPLALLACQPSTPDPEGPPALPTESSRVVSTDAAAVGSKPTLPTATVLPVADPTGTPRHAVVILIDTLRADAVAKADTPTIDALAGQGLVVERAWSTSTWTVPAVISLFTGSFVRTHGWDLPTGDMTHRPALPDLPTMAEVLRGAGFATHGLYANGYLAHELGFDRGFDEWRRSADARMARDVERYVKTWAEEDAGSASPKRHFLYLHLLGVHSGLSPTEASSERYGLDRAWFTERVGLLIGRAKRGQEPGVQQAYHQAYHAVVEDIDRQLGDILQALGPLREETLVVVLSDHGEELGEVDAYGHGWSVAEALTWVPLVAAGPGIAPGRRPTGTLAEVSDLVTDTLGVSHAWPVQSPWQGSLVAERHGKQAILAGGRWKGAWHGGDLTTYDLQVDATATTPVPGSERRVEDALRAWQQAVPQGKPLTGHVDFDDRTLQAIRALGYID